MAGDDDDTFHRDACSNNNFYGGTDLVFQEKGTLILGLGRLFSFSCILLLHNYNRKLLRAKAQDNVNVIPGLVLPYYFAFIYLYIGLSLVAGLVDVGISTLSDAQSTHIYNWLVPIEQAMFHWFYEGLSFFLMRYGAGILAIKRSLTLSGMWSLVTFLFYFFVFCSLRGTFHRPIDPDLAYGLITGYFAIMLAFYLAFVVIPKRYLFRRRALNFYSSINVLYYGISIIFSTVAYFGTESIVCPSSMLSFIYVALVQPFVLFRTLQIDSQYWQGLKPGKHNPLAEVWDHVDVETAQSMAEQAETVQADAQPGHALPILHYGLLDFDNSNTYVAGGFSRVYFGQLRGQRVALKILFAMELTPVDVSNFYHEASLLHSLRHENIVECKGVCIMPPALTMVLELCKFGSLFDFLYKPALEKKVVVGDLPFDAYVRESAEDDVVSSLHTNPSTITSMPSMAGSRSTNIAPLSVDISSVRSHPARSVNTGPSSTVSLASRVTPTSRAESGDGQGPRFSFGLNLQLLRGSMASRNSLSQSWSSPSQRSSESDVYLQNMAGDRNHETDKPFGDAEEKRQNRVTKTFEQVASYISQSFSMGNFAPPNPSPATAAGGGGPRVQTVMVSHAEMQSFDVRLRMMRDAAASIAFLHSRGVMHCDIKSLNFLVDENYCVKLADLGEARRIAGPPKHNLPPIPSRNWAPPEVLEIGAKADAYTVKSEIYGLAIVLCELLTLRLPHGDAPDRMTQKEWYHQLIEGEHRLDLPEFTPDSLRRIIEQSLQLDAVMRPNAQEVLQVLETLLKNRKAAGGTEEVKGGDV